MRQSCTWSQLEICKSVPYLSFLLTSWLLIVASVDCLYASLLLYLSKISHLSSLIQKSNPQIEVVVSCLSMPSPFTVLLIVVFLQSKFVCQQCQCNVDVKVIQCGCVEEQREYIYFSKWTSCVKDDFAQLNLHVFHATSPPCTVTEILRTKPERSQVLLGFAKSHNP